MVSSIVAYLLYRVDIIRSLCASSSFLMFCLAPRVRARKRISFLCLTSCSVEAEQLFAPVRRINIWLSPFSFLRRTKYHRAAARANSQPPRGGLRGSNVTRPRDLLDASRNSANPHLFSGERSETCSRRSELSSSASSFLM